jgi:hypothetical protein
LAVFFPWWFYPATEKRSLACPAANNEKPLSRGGGEYSSGGTVNQAFKAEHKLAQSDMPKELSAALKNQLRLVLIR